jgi:hypothetical protein
VKTKATEKTSDKFTKEEKENFSVVYEYTFKNSFDAIKVMQKHLPSINIPEKRFGEIFNAQMHSKKLTLTTQEVTEMDKLQYLIQKEKETYDLSVNNLVAKQNLNQKKYEEMKKEHTKNRFFQNEIYEIIKKREIINPKK